MRSKSIYLVPTFLGNEDIGRSIPDFNLEVIRELTLFVVENEKSARRFIKSVHPDKVQSSLEIHILNKNTSDAELIELAGLLDRDESIGVLSEAGMPAVADPGAKFIRLAHQKGISVVPLVGPSSILLALMASGMNGQNFTFNGYLPIDKSERKRAIKNLEKESAKNHSAQIFMETPYRNNQMLNDLKEVCSPDTSLCVACNITMPDEQIITATVKEWKQKKADFHKKPAIFILEC